MPEHVESGQCGCWGCLQEAELRNSLRSSVTLLTSAHHAVMPSGSEEFRTGMEDALLDQLEAAKDPSGEGGGSSGSAKGAPCDLTAVDLEERFRRELARWSDRWGASQRAGGSLSGSVIWAHRESGRLSPEAADTLAKALRSWVSLIQDMLHPPRQTPLDGRCPVCQAVEVQAQDDEGRPVRKAALVAVWDQARIDHVICRHCESVWQRPEFLDLATSMSPDLLANLLRGEASVVR